MSDEFEVFLNVDTDGDGENDGILETTDMDGDGYEETTMIYSDTDHDGIFEEQEVLMDTDGDGDVDATSISSDLDGDGLIDSNSTFIDADNDGFFESEQHIMDLNGDGVFDVASNVTYLDENGDGVMDTVVLNGDTDGDGIFDTVEVYQDADGDGTFEWVDVESLPDEYETDQIDPKQFVLDNPEFDLLNFDPNTDPNLVVGDPGKDMDNWEYQQSTNRCALFAQLFVIEELTGQEIDIEEFVDVAEANGWFTEDGGTYPDDMNKMLDYYGVENTADYNGDIKDIENCLENGGKVIVAVDGNEIWDENHDTEWYAPNDPNHAIEVIGIDYSDPDHPMVILNDSGHPDGEGLMVPLEQFESAWEDSNCQIITAYPEA